ncbi:MAG: tetratricopeptide repeat protein [Georgfuchsia sp.]
MSLVNKMLRDLDERRASELEKQGMSRHVRTLPVSRHVVQWKGVALTCAGALFGALIVWLLTGRQETNTMASAQEPVPTVAVPLPVTVTPPIENPAPIANPALVPFKPIQQPAPPPSSKQESSPKSDHPVEAHTSESPKAAPTPIVAARKNVSEAPPSTPPVIEKQPRTPVVAEAANAEYLKGMNAIKRDALDEAAAALRSALRIDAHHALARQALLSLLVSQKQWNEAETTGLDGLLQDPKQSGWAMLAARLQVERGDIPTAIKTLDQYAQYATKNPDYMVFHALLLQKSNRLPEAIERYRAALAFKPDEGRWWYGLGLALEAGQQPAEAKQAFMQARASANLPADLVTAVEQKLKGP